jgi:hypothetical protein
MDTFRVFNLEIFLIDFERVTEGTVTPVTGLKTSSLFDSSHKILNYDSEYCYHRRPSKFQEGID